MPTDVQEFQLTKALHAVEYRLKQISRESGYNTTPKVHVGAVMYNVVDTFPTIAIELGDLVPLSDASLYGSGGGISSTGQIRFGWNLLLWGYVKTDEGRGALYEKGLALLADMQSALYSEETLQDGSGAGTVLAINPGEIAFDMESLADENMGYLAASFTLVADLTRGSNP